MPATNPMTRCLAALCGLCVLAAAAGCDPYKAPGAGQADPLPAYPQIALQDNLAKFIFFEPPIVTPASDLRPLHVTVPLRSINNKPINIQYRFTFLDSNGQPTKGPSDHWAFMNLDPRVQRFVEGTALDTNAVGWRLEVRPAR